MDRNIFTEEANNIRKFQDFPWILFVLSLFFIAFLLSIYGCDKRESLKEQAKAEMCKQCRDILSMTYDKGENLKYTSEYGLGSDRLMTRSRFMCLPLLCVQDERREQLSSFSLLRAS